MTIALNGLNRPSSGNHPITKSERAAEHQIAAIWLHFKLFLSSFACKFVAISASLPFAVQAHVLMRSTNLSSLTSDHSPSQVCPVIAIVWRHAYSAEQGKWQYCTLTKKGLLLVKQFVLSFATIAVASIPPVQ